LSRTPHIKQAVILAGGRGTRLKPLTDTQPKALIEFKGKPFLGFLLEMLSAQGFSEVLLLLGYRAAQIKSYCGDGSAWELEISYSVTSEQNETGERLRLAADLIDEHFLLMYCDNYWPLDLQRLQQHQQQLGAEHQVTVYTNRDNYTRSNLRIGTNGYVAYYDKSRQAPDLQGVDIGYFLLHKSVLDLLPPGNVSFERTAMQTLITTGNMGAYLTDHRYYSVGDFKRLSLTEHFLAREATIILDRDGVLNKKAPPAEYITNWQQFQWLPDSREGLLALKQAGYRIIIITNQAGIARGMMTETDFEQLQGQLTADLKTSGGDIDAIYHCPHHWDDNCDCRKPKPGMLFQAQHDFDLDLSRTWFIGDDERDGQAAAAAGMPFILFKTGDSLMDTLKTAGLV